ncbi:MAG: TatD family hydrolase [Candidatus Saganbacteria bacterium]|nr:TatD family hydrolase [Candidatus Saganbacteria bacterium]
MYIDTHAHLTMDEFTDLPEVLKRAKDNGVTKIINASFDLESSKKSVSLAKEHDMIFASVGIHPHHADFVDDASINGLRELAANNKVVAIGETGLDYFENPVPKEVQKKAFARHIELAKELGLPLIFHGRDADGDMIEIIKEHGQGRIKGVFHCFSSDREFAAKVLEMGLMVSFTAVITFKNAHNVRTVAGYVPLESIMLETDCPYLAPQAMRGKRNEPSYVRSVAEKLAEIKNIPVEIIAERTSRNAEAFFKLS